jgi:SAM-dependent methyltransferase
MAPHPGGADSREHPRGWPGASAPPLCSFALRVASPALYHGRTLHIISRSLLIAWEVQEVSRLDTPARYDFITTFDAIHDQAKPAEVLQAVASTLRPGGIFLMVDIDASSHLEENMDLPLGPFLYTISYNHCMTVSLAEHGAGLGTMWGEQQARHMLSRAGFARIEVQHIEADFVNSYYIASRD